MKVVTIQLFTFKLLRPQGDVDEEEDADADTKLGQQTSRCVGVCDVFLRLALVVWERFHGVCPIPVCKEVQA